MGGSLARAASLILCSTLVPTAGAAEKPPGSLLGHFELVTPLTRGLTSRDSAVRARSAFLLGQIGSRECTAAIRPLLHDPSKAVRYQAGIALCHLGDEAGLPAAGAALASAAEWIRYYAVHGLAGLASDRARHTLEAQRPGQPELIAEKIDEALEMWPWPAVSPAPAEDPMGPYDTLHDLFIAAGGVFVVESDVYWHRGEYLQCVRCNETAIFLDPQHVELYGTSAWLLWSMGNNERAVSLLRQGVQANPDNWQVWFDYGFHYFLNKQYATAARLLRRAVELDAPAVRHRQYCHALERAGHPEQALVAWQELLEKYPDDPIAPRQITRLKGILRAP